MRAKKIFSLILVVAFAMTAGAAYAAEPIKIAQVVSKTGPLEQYAKQSITGFELGLEYATNGTMKIGDRPIEVIVKDTQGKPETGKQMLIEAYKDDKVDLAVGGVSSAVAKAMLPVAEEYEKILIVEPAVADSITGEDWNRYIFRTGRNSSQDAIGNAIAIAEPGVSIATLAQDYAFGRDGVAAFKEAAEANGAKVVHEEYVPTDTTDFTSPAQRIIRAMKDVEGEKYLFIIWAGKGNPFKIARMGLEERHDIKISSGGNTLSAMAQYKPLEGMEGAIYYYYEIPDNEINDWFVKKHQKRFDSPPDFFTCGGFAAAMAVVKALEEAGSTDTEKLISTMEDMEFQTAKGEMVFRPEDHQALQDMFAFKIKVDPDVKWAIPELTRVIKREEMDVPIRN